MEPRTDPAKTATTKGQSVLWLLTYKSYSLMPTGDGRWEVFRPSGVQVTFGGATAFSLRKARALVNLDLKA